jgi:hypothetical protein
MDEVVEVKVHVLFGVNSDTDNAGPPMPFDFPGYAEKVVGVQQKEQQQEMKKKQEHYPKFLLVMPTEESVKEEVKKAAAVAANINNNKAGSGGDDGDGPAFRSYPDGVSTKLRRAAVETRTIKSALEVRRRHKLTIICDVYRVCKAKKQFIETTTTMTNSRPATI